MQLIALRQTCGDYGMISAGQVFTADDEVARQLIMEGIARRPDPPRIVYETKVVVPEAPEVSARQPFRDLHLPDDPEPPALAAVRDSVLAAANVQQQGTVDNRRKRGRPRKHPA